LFLKDFFMTSSMPSSKIFYDFLFGCYKRLNQRGEKKSCKKLLFYDQFLQLPFGHRPQRAWSPLISSHMDVHSVRPSVRPSDRPSVRPSVCPSFRPSIRPYIRPYIRMLPPPPIFQGGRLPAVFYPFGHPMPYAYEKKRAPPGLWLGERILYNMGVRHGVAMDWLSNARACHALSFYALQVATSETALQPFQE
jgi:hypothetical protein